jgi:antitoxin HicB
MQFVYPYAVRQSDDGAWQVRFPDIPEAMTEGATEAQAHALAADALLAALGGLEKLHRDIPEPSRARHRTVVVVPVLQSVKLALYQAMREHGLNNVTMSKRLGKAETEVRRMLDLDHQTRIGALEDALRVLGRQIATEVRWAA